MHIGAGLGMVQILQFFKVHFRSQIFCLSPIFYLNSIYCVKYYLGKYHIHRVHLIESVLRSSKKELDTRFRSAPKTPSGQVGPNPALMHIGIYVFRGRQYICIESVACQQWKCKERSPNKYGLRRKKPYCRLKTFFAPSDVCTYVLAIFTSSIYIPLFSRN